MRTRATILGLLQALFVLAGLALVSRPLWHRAGQLVASHLADRQWERAQQQPNRVELGGDPAAWLRLPAADIDTLVVREGDSDDLLRFPCLWMPDFVLRDPSELRLIRAHRDLHFRGLANIAVGDDISLEWRVKPTTRYRVVETEILAPDQAEQRILEKRSEPWLVLMTCYPFRYVGAAPSRFLVWARPMKS
jgi:sortase A